MDGVVTPPFSTILSKVLNELGKTRVNLLALPNFTGLCNGLALGQVDDLAFCRSIGESAGLTIGPQAFRERVIAAMAANPMVIQTIQLLPRPHERWLVIPFPDSWFDQVAERLGVLECFSAEKMIRLSQSGLGQVIPDVFNHLAWRAQIPLPDGLLVDASSRRCVQALNHGLPSAIYVDPRRLEREFIMRHFIDQPQPLHRPDVSV
jgi:hypothetical protein